MFASISMLTQSNNLVYDFQQGNTAKFVLRLFSGRHLVLCRSPKGDRASAEGDSRACEPRICNLFNQRYKLY